MRMNPIVKRLQWDRVGHRRWGSTTLLGRYIIFWNRSGIHVYRDSQLLFSTNIGPLTMKRAKQKAEQLHQERVEELIDLTKLLETAIYVQNQAAGLGIEDGGEK